MRKERNFLQCKTSTEELVEAFRNGKMVILVDDEGRENEGDLIIPAQMATPDAINFMARFARGLICLSLSEEQVKKLGLSLMPQRNSTRYQTAFTVSIEASEGVTTGISARDRAHTIATAIAPDATAKSIATPGHIFPVIARPGGVLERAGHTEAAIDLVRLAHLNPSAVICEIMNDDGTMARRDDLVIFAETHQIKIGSIADLIAYRLKDKMLIERQVEKDIVTPHGPFRMIVYQEKMSEKQHVALIKGKIFSKKTILVRMHASDFLADICGGGINEPSPDFLNKAMAIISKKESGVIVLLRGHENDSLHAEIQATDNKKEEVKKSQTIRYYGIGAQILLDIGVKNMKILSNSDKQLAGFEGFGLSIISWQNFDSET